MVSLDENTVMLMEFLEKGDCRLLIIYVNSQGQLSTTTTYPGATKAKVSHLHSYPATKAKVSPILAGLGWAYYDT